MNDNPILDYEQENIQEHLKKSFLNLRIALGFFSFPFLLALLLRTAFDASWLMLLGSTSFLLSIIFALIGCWNAAQSFRHYEGSTPQRVIALIGNAMILLAIVGLLFSAVTLSEETIAPQPVQVAPIVVE